VAIISANLFSEDLSLGSASWGMPYGIGNDHKRTDREEVIKILYAAREMGIKHLDTANAYGDAEKVIGDSGLSRSFSVTSKFSFKPFIGLSARNRISLVDRMVWETLERLKCDKLYGLLIHDPKTALSHQRVVQDVACRIANLGVVGKIGVSVNYLSDLKIFQSIEPLRMVQVPGNILDQRFSNSATLQRLRVSKRVEVHVRSVFLQGLLLSMSGDVGKRFNGLDEQIKKIDRICISKECSRLEFLLSSVKSFRIFDKIVVGAFSVEQVRSIAESRFIDIPINQQRKFHTRDLRIISPQRWRLTDNSVIKK